MNKLKDLFLLIAAFELTICISVSMRTNLDAHTTSVNTNITIDLPSDFPGVDIKKDGWHFYIYKNSRGCLCYKNSCLVGQKINDYYVTSWGNCYWHGEPGWQFYTAKGPIGTKLTL